MTVNEAKGKIVLRIFEMAATGIGKRLIARRLNDEKIPTFGKSATWGHSYIQKILSNRAVLGEYQPHKGKTSNRKRPGNRKPDGELRIDFFPAVITPELWNRAHRSIAGRHTISVNGNSTGQFGGANGALHNLFTGLVFDANCGLPMHHSDRGKRDRPRLVTNSKEINGTTPNSIIYVNFEEPFLYWLVAVDWNTIIDPVDTEGLKVIEEEIASVNLSIDRTRSKSEKLTDYLLTLPNPAATFNDRLLKLQDEEAAFQTELKSTEARLAEAKSKHQDLTDEFVDLEAISQTKDFATRSRIRQDIRRKVARIDSGFTLIRTPPPWLSKKRRIYFRLLVSNSPTEKSGF